MNRRASLESARTTSLYLGFQRGNEVPNVAVQIKPMFSVVSTFVLLAKPLKVMPSKG